MNPSPVLALDEIDLSDLAFWARPLEEREAAFEALRRERPIVHFEDPEPPPGVSFPVPLDGSGYWAVTRHADIVEASRDPEHFCSGQGATSIFDMPTEFLEFFGSMINLDDPRQPPVFERRGHSNRETAVDERVDAALAKHVFRFVLFTRVVRQQCDEAHAGGVRVVANPRKTRRDRVA